MCNKAGSVAFKRKFFVYVGPSVHKIQHRSQWLSFEEQANGSLGIAMCNNPGAPAGLDSNFSRLRQLLQMLGLDHLLAPSNTVLLLLLHNKLLSSTLAFRWATRRVELYARGC